MIVATNKMADFIKAWNDNLPGMVSTSDLLPIAQNWISDEIESATEAGSCGRLARHLNKLCGSEWCIDGKWHMLLSYGPGAGRNGRRAACLYRLRPSGELSTGEHKRLFKQAAKNEYNFKVYGAKSGVSKSMG